VIVLDRQNLIRQLSPNIRIALNHKAGNMKLKPRIIFDYELLYLEQGSLKVTISDRIHEMFPGDMVLFKPGIEHSIVSGGPGQAWMPHIHFDAMFYKDFNDVKINFKTYKLCSQREKDFIREDILGKSGVGIPDIIRIPNHLEVLKRLKSIIYYFERKGPYSLLAQKALTIEILHQILSGLEADHSELTSNHITKMDEAVTYIINHYNKKIYIDDLAKICCLSTHYFERLFKKDLVSVPPNIL
jgi:hypothetical protein